MLTAFDNWKLRTKLLVSFTVLSTLTALVGLVGISNMAKLSESSRTIYNKELLGLSFVKEANINLVYLGRSIRALVLATSEEERQAALKSGEDARIVLLEQLDSAGTRFYTPAGQAALAQVRAAAEDYLRVYKQVQVATLAEPMAQQRTSVELLKSELNPRATHADTLMTLLSDMKTANAATASVEADALYRSSRNFMVLVIVTSVLAGLGLGLLIANRLGRAIHAVVQAANAVREQTINAVGRMGSAIAQGDLTTDIAVPAPRLGLTRTDEIGDVARTFDTMASEAREAGEAIQNGRSVLRQLITQTSSLVGSASNGDLTSRADAGSLQGGYRQLTLEVNALLDAVVAPMRDAGRTLEAIAERELTARVQGQYRGEFAAMATAIDTAANNLEEAMAQVGGAAQQVSSAGAQIASGSQALASGSSEQAASLEEISSSLTELSAQAKVSAEYAAEGRRLSDSAREAAREGTTEMARLSTTVREIQDAASQTARIVKSIDEIAFQTNLLALNAAVEAARAGDAGRGFAVVADEVRALALRSAEAARNTTDLIERSQQIAAEGVALNARVAERLDVIDRTVHSVGEAITQVADASGQQADGILQIEVAVNQLNGTTQHVAANAEESASASEELAGQAQELTSLVGQFQVRRDGSIQQHARSISRRRVGVAA
ncbi:HAMP domain-containing methyl-accepting chemotaxis protein [Gemmatimonas aurantiaca]|nr:methyl-accepting chemotaxis protein [Gemmatimonas aurantiaca]